jgi:hypothetical protein
LKKKLIAMIIFMNFFVVSCGPIDPLSPIVSGVIMWIEGEAHKYYSHDSGTIYRSVKRACEELNYQITKDEIPDSSSSQNYYVVAGTNDRFKINIKEIEKNIAKLSVRVNFMGDKPYAELLYQKVDDQLATIEFGPDGRPVRK